MKIIKKIVDNINKKDQEIYSELFNLSQDCELYLRNTKVPNSIYNSSKVQIQRLLYLYDKITIKPCWISKRYIIKLARLMGSPITLSKFELYIDRIIRVIQKPLIDLL